MGSMRAKWSAVAVACVSAFAIGCRSGGGGACCPTAAIPPSSGPVGDQVARGEAIFQSSCAKCHGTSGGGKALGGPMLIGPGGLPLDPPAGRIHRDRPFRTAGNVAGFIHARMPPGGARLPEDQAYDVAAWLVTSNGVRLSQPLTAQNADTVAIH